MTGLKDFSLEGKNAWITGAAYGIGFSIAEAFVNAGIKNIVFNVRSEEAVQKALAAYKTAGIENVRGYVSDQDGNPVVGLKMVVQNTDYPSHERVVTQTDVEGYFSVSVPDDLDVENLLQLFSRKGTDVVKYWVTPTGQLHIVIETEKK